MVLANPKKLIKTSFQAGPIESVEIPRTKDGRVRNYAFITYVHVNSVPYAFKLFAEIQLYNRKLVLRNRKIARGSTHLKEPKVGKSIIKKIPHVSVECQESKGMQKNSNHRHKRQNSQIKRADKDNSPNQKIETTIPVLPRIPLRVNNECQVYRKILDNTGDTHCMNQLPHSSMMGQSFRGPEVNPILNYFPPGTINLTTQLLSNYIYIMQKVIPHWPRMQ